MPARYLLDTDTCIYFLRRREPRIVRRLQAHAHHAAISVITLGELEFGRAGSSDPESVREAIDLLTGSFEVAPLPAAAAEPYGRVRAALRARGTPIGQNDLWIAAQALAADLILVTNNEKEFRRVPGLKVQNWAR
jgi:tRNA(fMet)-specific endonuclease VapC